MKILSLFLILLIGISLSTVCHPAEPNWTQIRGLASPGSEAYLDKSGLEIKGEGKNRISFAIILLVSKAPINIKIGEKSFMVRSIARALVMDCQNGNIMPVGDLYYSTKFPKEKEKSIHSVEYDTKNTAAIIGNKSSPLYNTLCPTSV